MQLIIYQPSGNIRAYVKPDNSTEEAKELMGQDVFNLGYSSPVPVHLEYGDYVIVQGRKFRLNAPQSLTKNADRNYEYKVALESDTQQLGKVLYLFLDRYNRYTESEFPFTGTPEEFLNLLIGNLTRVYADGNWQIGYVLDAPQRTIEFSSNNCLEVLNILAEAFGTEWLIEGNKISLYRKQSNSGIILQYGKGKGVLEMTIDPQTNSNPITRVYGYGSNRNLGSNYRLGARRLRMSESLYLEKNTGLDTGTGPYDIVEVTKVFEDIYPRRNGAVTSVTTPFIFADSSMDFDVNTHLMPGDPPPDAKLIFTSGQLAGNTFVISNYNNSTKTFTILGNTEDQTLEIPSELLPPAVGDTYVLVDILMPDSYISNAEAELKQAVQDHLDQVAGEVPPVINVICDPLYFKSTGNSFSLGQVVTVKDDFLDINRQIRIIGYTRNWRDPFMYTLKLADAVKDNALVKLINP